MADFPGNVKGEGTKEAAAKQAGTPKVGFQSAPRGEHHTFGQDSNVPANRSTAH